MNTARISEIRSQVRALGDRERARNSRRFFKTGPGEYGEGDQFLGIRVPELRAIARRHKDATAGEAAVLLESRYHEERLLALLLLVGLFERSGEEGRRQIYELYLARTRYVNNWDLVDASAHGIVGAWLEGRSTKPLFDLARSEVLWERRIAVIATHRFIEIGSCEEALAVAAVLLEDEHDLIHKAVGWTLREVGKRDLAAEEAFLKRHYRRMPRTMLRYAIERFPERRRKEYLEGSV